MLLPLCWLLHARELTLSLWHATVGEDRPGRPETYYGVYYRNALRLFYFGVHDLVETMRHWWEVRVVCILSASC